MSDVPPLGSPTPTPSTCRLLDAGGICADYRKKLDVLHDASVASGAVGKLIVSVAALAVTTLGGLGAYLWSRLADVDSTLKMAKEEISAAASGVVVPVGTVVAWSAAQPPRPTGPDGKERELRVGDWHYHWRVCDGSEVDLFQHAQLSATIGSTYGKAENGKVKLPDFRGFFLRGEGMPFDRAQGSDRIGRAQPDALQDHAHTFGVAMDGGGGTRTVVLHNSPDRRAGINDDRYGATLGMIRTFQGDGTRGEEPRGAIETRPANFAVHWIIRIK